MQGQTSLFSVQNQPAWAEAFELATTMVAVPLRQPGLAHSQVEHKTPLREVEIITLNAMVPLQKESYIFNPILEVI